MDRGSGNLCSTVGGKVHVTAKSVINVVGSSSFCREGSIVAGIMRTFSGASARIICKSIHFIGPGGLSGAIHCCSSGGFTPRLFQCNFVPTRPAFFACQGCFRRFNCCGASCGVTTSCRLLVHFLCMHRLGDGCLPFSFVGVHAKNADATSMGDGVLLGGRVIETYERGKV